MAFATINKPSNYFDTKLYTGTGSAQSITGLGFSPDFVWIKDRTSANNHRLLDIIRGATKELYSSTTDAETTQAQSLTAFNSDGFSVGTLSSVNTNGNNYASWCWDANGAGVSNTAGTISSTVSANTTSGFSIVTYTGNGTSGATVGHGLGAVPAFIIQKSRSVVDAWLIYNKSRGANYGLALDETTAEIASSTYWNNTAPTSSVFSIGNNGKVNTNGGTHVAYCFAEVKGFSKFGSYVANGSLDNAFVYTGFKPAMVIIKRSDGANSWTIFDNKRDPYNEVVTHMAPNNTIADDTNTTYNDLDFLSNGFKVREDNDEVGASGGNYIYMAFAEQPLVGTNNVPATAR